MNITLFNPPRLAFVEDKLYSRRSDVLRDMGLPTQEFRAVGQDADKNVVVHPDDLSVKSDKPFTLRGSIVRFKDS